MKSIPLDTSESDATPPFWARTNLGLPKISHLAASLKKMIDPKFVVTISSIVFIGGMNWQLSRSTAAEMRRDIDSLKAIPQIIQSIREDAIRQESKMARLDAIEVRQKEIQGSLTENTRMQTDLRKEVGDVFSRTNALQMALGDNLTSTEFRRWELRLSKSNPSLTLPE